MKSIVNGRIYDTCEAEWIVNINRGEYNDFHHESTTLYKTKKGNFFLSGHGGPLSRWGKTEDFGNGLIDGSGTQPVDPAAALAFAEDAGLDADVAIEHFGDLLIEA